MNDFSGRVLTEVDEGEAGGGNGSAAAAAAALPTKTAADAAAAEFLSSSAPAAATASAPAPAPTAVAPAPAATPASAPATAAEEEMVSPPRSGRWRLFGILALLAAFGPFATDMYLPALPEIEGELGARAGAAQATLSIFFFAAGVGQLFYGPLSDRVGRRVPLLAGTTLFVAASVACIFVTDIGGMMFWRLCMGLGASAGMVLSRAVVRDKFGERECADAFSLLMVVMGAAPILAPILGGQLLLVAPWRHIFTALAGIGLLALAGVWFGLPESLPVSRRVRGGTEGGFFSGYSRLLRDRNFLGFALVQGCNAGAFFTYITCAPRVFIGDFAVSPQAFTAFFGLNSVGLLGVSWLNRRLLRRHSPLTVLRTGLAAVALVGLLLAAAAWTGAGRLPAVAGLLFLVVASNGMVGPNSTALALAPFGRGAGSASAFLGSFQFAVGGVAGGVATWLGGGARPMSAVVLACSVAALAAFLLLARGRRGAVAVAGKT